MATSEKKALAAAARLLGRLLIAEVDELLLDWLQAPERASALAAAGILVPPSTEIEDLHADYCSCFLAGPSPVPLVQSLWEQGAYEGWAAQALSELANAAGLEYDKQPARAAPLDHLGSILFLWADLAVDWPEAGDHIRDRHLAWARQPLGMLAERPGFYGSAAAAVIDLIVEIESY